MVLPVGSDDVNRINAQTRVIAVWMPNTNVIGEGAWGSYRVSVDEVEKQTGYNLLLNAPESVQKGIEASTDSFNI
ncbi:hypothetical protein GCM10028808_29960 [Spirosoma migulaei]